MIHVERASVSAERPGESILPATLCRPAAATTMVLAALASDGDMLSQELKARLATEATYAACATLTLPSPFLTI